MGSRNRSARRNAQRAARRSAPTTATRAGFSGLVPLYGMPNAEKVSESFESFASIAYMGSSPVYSVVSRRMSLFSEATFKYRSLGDKHLFGDPSLLLLEQPWPNGTAGDLLARMELDVSLAGNAYIRSTGDRLERLRPDWVTIVSQVTTDSAGRQVREIVGYYYEPVGDPDREPEYIPVDEVAHWAPIPDPCANWRGMSWLTPVIREINSDIQMSEYRDAYFRNGATPNLLIKYADKVPPERVAALKSAIEAQHTGSRNAFKTMILDEGADPVVVGNDMGGSAFDALQAAGETRIASAAGIPPLLAGFRQGATITQVNEYSQAMRVFADTTMRPLWRSACAALEKLLQIPAGAQLWYDVTDVAALRQGELDFAETMAAQAKTINTLIMAGFVPDSVVAAVQAGDLTLMVHTGLVSVQMQKLEAAQPTPDSSTPTVQGG